MDYKQLTAPCGLDCFNCPMYVAKTNEKLRATMAKMMNMPFEKAYCLGCRDEKGIISSVGRNEPCIAYKCSVEKGVDFCFECAEFPCDHFQPRADKASQRPHNIKVFNLCLIKKMGVESWAKSKAKTVRDTYFKGQF